MGGDGSQKLLPWRGISFLSGAQTSGSQQNLHQHCTGKLGRISVGGWLSYTRTGSFLEITPGSILASAEVRVAAPLPSKPPSGLEKRTDLWLRCSICGRPG